VLSSVSEVFESIGGHDGFLALCLLVAIDPFANYVYLYIVFVEVECTVDFNLLAFLVLAISPFAGVDFLTCDNVTVVSHF
jgi:hypothetical protein